MPTTACGRWRAGQEVLAYRVQGSAEIPLAAYLGEAVDDARLTSASTHPVSKRLGRFVAVHGNEALFRTSTCSDRPPTISASMAVELAEPFRRRVLVRRRSEQGPHPAQQIGRFLVLQYITPELTNEVRFVDLAARTFPRGGPRTPGSRTTARSRHSPAMLSPQERTSPTRASRHRRNARGRPARAAQGHEAAVVQVSFDARGSSTSAKTTQRGRDTDTDTAHDPQRISSTRRSSYLYYYGAIGAVTLPAWNTTFQMILELGGMVAIANIRGGGEFGFRWQDPDIKRDRRQDIGRHHRGLTMAEEPIPRAGRHFGTLLWRHAHPGLHGRSPRTTFDLFVAEMPVSDVVEFLENGVFGRSAWDDFGFPHNAAGDLQKTNAGIDALKRWSPNPTGPRGSSSPSSSSRLRRTSGWNPLRRTRWQWL